MPNSLGIVAVLPSTNPASLPSDQFVFFSTHSIHTMDNPENVLISSQEVVAFLNIYGNIGDNDSPLTVNDVTHYQKAFTHESYYQSVRHHVSTSNVTKCYLDYIPTESYERLEFLGDHILKAVMGRYLYERYPNEREGFLTSLKIKIEKCSTLHKMAVALGFKKYILLSLSIENLTLLGVDMGRNTVNFYEDVFEAFVGAILVDNGEKGLVYADRFVRNVIEELVDFSELNSVNDNYKECLVKVYNTHGLGKPVFVNLEDSEKVFKKVFPKLVLVKRDLLSPSQLARVQDYTEKVLMKFKDSPEEITRVLDADTLILALGYGRKNIQSEQECCKQALVNLDFSD